jgi:5-oxoprolinase (ATP-hydrolysing) subunit A
MPAAAEGARLDFNCDLGEGCGDDAAIVACISSASIACGGHAGDPGSIREAVALCARHGVAVGAHPSFEDRTGFGRRHTTVDPGTIEALVARQVEAVAAECRRQGVPLCHVKPHGALYNLAARDAATAAAIVTAVHAHDSALWLYALAGSELARRGEASGLRVAHEAFAERRYEADGSLTPRSHADACIGDLDGALAQVRQLVSDGMVTARTGERVRVRADTMCLHGDRADAPAFARALRAALHDAGVQVRAPGAGR